MTRPEPFGKLELDKADLAMLIDAAIAIMGDLDERLPNLPVNRARPAEEVRARFTRELPNAPVPVDEIAATLRDLAFEYSTYTAHPRFMGFVTGPGTFPGAIADMIASTINQNLAAWRLSPGATEIELQVVRWFAALFGMPSDASGLFVSGGATANLIALKAARDAALGPDVRRRGIQGSNLRFYASAEVHDVVTRAADILGLGSDAVVRVPVDDRHRMSSVALEEKLVTDIKAGLLPAAIVGTAGTTATGAIDPLEELAEIAAERDTWFHVDACYGGAAALAEDLKPLLKGIERADSIAFDPHKWLYTSHSGGCVVMREPANLDASFAMDPAFVYEDKAESRTGVDLRSRGLEFSRGFNALKVWVSLLAYGAGAYGRRISHDAALARYLGALIDEHPHLQKVLPVSLSVCCFRFAPEGAEDVYLDELNRRIMTTVQLGGRTFVSNALIRGRFVLRACIVNFRTEADDVDNLVREVVKIGHRLHESELGT